MRDIRATGKVIGLERVAIMAALNLSHEVLGMRGGEVPAQLDGHEDRIKAITSQLDEALYQLRQLEIN
jgi:cell division protein ZapA